MKTASAALIALLNAAGGGQPLIKFDMYTFSLVGGGQLLYTTADFPIAPTNSTIWDAPKVDGSGNMFTGGMTWQPFNIQSDSRGHWKLGLDVDTWRATMLPRVINPVSGAAFPDKIGSIPWIQAAGSGALDNADVIISRAYFSAMPTYPIPVAGLSPVGTLHFHRGLSGPVVCSGAAAQLSILDYRSLLSQQMPRNVYQASCRHRLYDSRCTLIAATFTKTGTAKSTSTRGSIVATGSVAAPAGSTTFTLGTLTMTSGLNSGIQRMVSLWNGTDTFSMLSPFPFTVAAGDTFSVAAGCDKSQATCTAFGNLVNFGAEPYIPIPEVSLG